jgi:tetratricopeptide (TPR) repeat protein
MNIKLKNIYLIIFILIAMLLLPDMAISQPFEPNAVIGITQPIIKDSEAYKGLDFFIYDYYNKYLDDIKGIRTTSHYTASQMIDMRFGRDSSIEKMYSGFISQLKLYMDFDLLMASELSTVVDEDDGIKYYRLRVIIFDSNANIVVKFKITSQDRFKIIKYLNQSIPLIAKRVKSSHPDYEDLIQIDEDINDKLKANEDLGYTPSLSYYYIKDYTEEELQKKQAEIMKILQNEGYTTEDIAKGLSRKYMEAGVYHKALSYLLGTISRNNDEDSIHLFLNIARDCMDSSLFSTAIELINDIVLYKDLSNPLLEIEVNLVWSNILIETGDFIEAEALVIASSDTARKYGYIPFLIKSLTNYALVYANVGEYKKSMTALKDSRKTIEEMASRMWASDFLYDEARSRLEMSEFDEALESCLLAEQLFKSAGKSNMLIKNHILKAEIHRDLEQYDQANDEINKAMEYVIETNQFLFIKEINELMRGITKRSTKASRAYSVNEERDYVRLYNDNIKSIHDRTFLKGMARLLLYWGNYEGAEEVLQQALEISKRLQSESYKYDDYMLMGKINQEAGQKEQAFLNYANALTSSEKSASKVDQMGCLFNLANVFYIRENVDKALSTYEALVKSAEVYGLYELLEKSYYRMSLIYKDLGDEDKYIEYSRKAFNIAKKIGSFMVDVYNEPLKDD